MPTSSTEPGSLTRLVFVDESDRLGPSLLLDGGRVVARGDAPDEPSAAAATVLVVPGDRVAVHWLDLADGLTPAQAAAAARLMLADVSAEPLSSMHVAVGRPEHGRTPAAMVPAQLMSGWLAAASAAGLDPDAVVPTPLLLRPPEAGFVRRDRNGIADYRGPAAAFTLEPELAETIVGDAAVESLDEASFEQGLGTTAPSPVLNLRQGPFARRRQWRLERGRARRVAIFAAVLVLLSLVVQVATILSYTFAADRAQAEADALGSGGAGAAGDGRPGFGPGVAILFETVRATPNAELARIDYRRDGTLVATVTTDSPATLTALQGRLEASGFTVEPGARSNAGGRASTELTLRPA